MLGPVLAVVGALVVVVVALGLVFLLGMRANFPPVVDTQRRINKAFINPRAMRSAGSPGATAAVVRHTGRSSGATYKTPVGPFRTDDGFVVALPYGTRSDWVKNVLAGGPTTVIVDGQEYAVDRPELVTFGAAAEFLPEPERRRLRAFNVDKCLRLHLADRGA
jgi:deazaflavin-dependent oxidoreductase (nitroreductase family)